MLTNREIVMENVRRYRAIASLCRQTAALRPLQSWSLQDQAEGVGTSRRGGARSIFHRLR
jgi:hypothetical protein